VDVGSVLVAVVLAVLVAVVVVVVAPPVGPSLVEGDASSSIVSGATSLKHAAVAVIPRSNAQRAQLCIRR
jgi:hypothetical protein